MSTNLISAVSQALSPSIIASIASALGMDASTIEKAVRAAVPGFLSALAGMSSKPEGARLIASAIASPAVSRAIGNIEGGAQTSSLIEAGASQLSALLGGNVLGSLASAVGKFAGMREGSARGLFGLLGPLVLNVLGKEQQKAGLDAGGLARPAGVAEGQLCRRVSCRRLQSACGQRHRGIDPWRGSCNVERVSRCHVEGIRRHELCRAGRAEAHIDELGLLGAAHHRGRRLALVFPGRQHDAADRPGTGGRRTTDHGACAQHSHERRGSGQVRDASCHDD